MYTLRDYQEQASKDIKSFMKSKDVKGILVGPVASGKSLYTGLFAKYADSPTLVIQPSKELLEQNYEKAISYGLKPTIYSASMREKNISNLIYATPGSIVNHPDKFKHIKYVVIDECHLNLTRKLYRGKISDVSRIEEFLNIIKPQKVLGLTATPILLVNTSGGSSLRMINRTMRSYFYKAKMVSITQIKDIYKKYWCGLEYKTLSKYNNSALEYNKTGAEFSKESIIKVFDDNGGVKTIIEALDKLLINDKKKNCLVFLPSLLHGMQLAKKDKRVVLLDNETKPKDRVRILNDFRDGKIKVLANYGVLTTGYDYPDLESIIMARETASFQLYYQIIGRVVRPFIKSRQKTATVVDLTSNYKRFGDVRELMFEDRKEVGGWALMKGNKVITGFTSGSIDKFPTIDEIEKALQERRFKSQSNFYRGKIKDNNVRFTFGKHKGKTVKEVALTNKGYLQWIMGKAHFDFSRMGEYGRALEKEIKRVMLEKDLDENGL